MSKTILKCVVGSYAHGLATEKSDIDYRTVYVTPTSELLKLGVGPYKGTTWIEGETEDNTAYEIGHFLHLSSKSNPSILEVFKAPIILEDGFVIKNEPCGGILDQCPFDQNEHAGYFTRFKDYNHMPPWYYLRQLFPFIWSSKGVYEAFRGYSHNQHKKLFDERDEFSKRKGKYAVAHLRVLLSGIELLSTNNFDVKVPHYYNKIHLHLPLWCIDWLESKGRHGEPSESWRNFLFDLKGLEPEQVPIGVVIDTSEYLKSKLKQAYDANPNKQTDLEKVNEFLLEIRRKFW